MHQWPDQTKQVSPGTRNIQVSWGQSDFHEFNSFYCHEFRHQTRPAATSSAHAAAAAASAAASAAADDTDAAASADASPPLVQLKPFPEPLPENPNSAGRELWWSERSKVREMGEIILAWICHQNISHMCFTESAPRPTQSISRDVRLCVVCCAVPLQFFKRLVTSNL